MATKTRKPAAAPEQITRDNVVDRVRKLMALAARPGTPEEAATAAAKAQEIILKYGIAESELAESERETYVSAYAAKATYVANCRMKQEQTLMAVVCHASFCRVVFVPVDNNHVYADVIGQAHNIEIVDYLYHYLLRTIDSLGRLGHKQYLKEYDVRMAERRDSGDYSVGDSEGDEGVPLGYSKFSHGFRAGAISAINLRLSEQRAKAEQDANTGNATTALVVRKDAEVREALDRLYPDRKAMNSRHTNLDTDAMDAGFTAGMHIAINKAIQ